MTAPADDPWRVRPLAALGLALLYASIVAGAVVFAQGAPAFVYQGF